MNVFTWKLCREGLPTRHSKFIRKMELDDCCLLCDREAENGFHATVASPQAQGLRLAMREHWCLPEESKFSYTGPDWLLVLLEGCTEEQRDLMKLILWRAWTVHNNITHQLGLTSIMESVHFLLAMQSSLCQIQRGVDIHDQKGKQPSYPSNNRKENKKEQAKNGTGTAWERPSPGWMKVNVDGSFVAQIEAGVGVVIRRSNGEVVLTTWRVLFRCSDAVEAKVSACVKGLWLAAQLARGPITLESDCARIVHALQRREDKSDLSFLIGKVVEQAQMLSEWRVSQVKRERNLVDIWLEGMYILLFR